MGEAGEGSLVHLDQPPESCLIPPAGRLDELIRCFACLPGRRDGILSHPQPPGLSRNRRLGRGEVDLGGPCPGSAQKLPLSFRNTPSAKFQQQTFSVWGRSTIDRPPSRARARTPDTTSSMRESAPVPAPPAAHRCRSRGAGGCRAASPARRRAPRLSVIITLQPSPTDSTRPTRPPFATPIRSPWIRGHSQAPTCKQGPGDRSRRYARRGVRGASPAFSPASTRSARSSWFPRAARPARQTAASTGPHTGRPREGVHRGVPSVRFAPLGSP